MENTMDMMVKDKINTHNEIEHTMTIDTENG